MLRFRKHDWSSDFGSEDYIVRYWNDVTYLYFLCPGCGKLIGVKHPGWSLLDIENLTARESILHMEPDGCGWHGYLTRGELHTDSRPV